MKKWPKELWALGRRYQVRYVSDTKYIKDDDGDELVAQVSFWRRVIRVGLKTHGVRRTKEDIFLDMMHEMMHVIIEDDSAIKKIVGNHVEEFVTRFSKYLADILLRNGFVRL